MSFRGKLRKLLDNWHDRFVYPIPDTKSAHDNQLCKFNPVNEKDQFANGGIIMVNNALSWGGVERQIVYLLQELPARTERKLSLICMNLNSGPDFRFYLPMLENSPVDISNARPIGWSRKQLKKLLDPITRENIKHLFLCLPPDVRLITYRFLAEFLTRRPAVVHAWQDTTSIAAGFAAVITGVPRIILSSRNVRPTQFAYYRPYMLHAYQQLASCPRVILVNNSEYGAVDYAEWLGLDKHRYIVKRNGIDSVAFKRAPEPAQKALRKSLGIPADAPLVGSIFRFYPEKRPFLWLNVAKCIQDQNPDTHFVIFGTGSMQEDIKDYARKIGLNEHIHLPGTTDNAALAISSMDVFLLTSTFEGTPNTVLEAQLVEVPVVVTEAGGTRETLDPGKTGWLLTRTDPEEIAKYVLDLLADPELASKMAVEGRRFVISRYGLQRMVEETLALYDLTPVNPVT